MSIGECCCIDVGEAYELLRQDIRTARIPHRCGECQEEIRPGDRYEYAAGVYDGGWYTHRTCWRCLCVRRDFFSCGWIYENLREDFRECFGWDYVTGPTRHDVAEEWDPLFDEELDPAPAGAGR